MSLNAKRVFKGIGITLVVYILSVLLLFYTNVLWMSPPYFNVEEYDVLEVSIMSMDQYDDIVNTHRRPYYFSISNLEGSAHIIGVDHTNDLEHHHLDSIKVKWNQVKPSVALVESRLGFLFALTQNPIEKYGERGLTAALAKKDDARVYTWEPEREKEVSFLLNKYSGQQLALFYVLRPYFSYSINYRENNSEALLDKLIEERTAYQGLQNLIRSSKDIEDILNRDYPDFDWKAHLSAKGWPEGYLREIWNDSNLFRDKHMVQIIIELVAKGETVFVTMGTSHAPRIEKTLAHELLN